MAIPDVVIAGAPKCGTTALAAALDAHPEFHVGPIKEPRHFAGMQPDRVGPMSEGFNESLLVDRGAYEANFAAAGSARTVDASTDYLSCPGSAERIAAANPAAKIIIGLRAPVARCWSEHLHLKRNDAEPLDFSASLDAEPQRIADRWMPLFHHIRRSRYADGIEEFHAAFGRDGVFVYRHEELRSDAASVTGALGAFLAVTDPIEMVGDHNVGGAPKSEFVNRLLRSEQGVVQQIRHRVAGLLPDRLKDRVRDAVDSVNLDRSTDIPPDAAERIIAELRDDIERVAGLTGIDVSDWVAVPG